MSPQNSFNRSVTGLRISVTQDCNLDCIYCHREGQIKNKKVIGIERIHKIVEASSRLGVKKIKLTGGEPLMRKDLVDLVAGLSGVEGIEDISLTSNGTLLHKSAHRLKEAGLDRINISLDTLDPLIYSKITRSSPGHIKDTIKGLDAALDAGFYLVKLNMVVLNNINEDRIQEMINFAGEKEVTLQLIELVSKESPLYYSLSEIEKDLGLKAKKITKRHLHSRKKYLVDGAEVEIIRPHRPSFCMNCRRLRLTSDGRFKMCLLRNDSIEIRDDIEAAFIEAVEKRTPYIIE